MSSPTPSPTAPTSFSLPDASLSIFNQLPLELLEIILSYAASAGDRRRSYLEMMHVCRAFHAPCERLLHRDIVTTTRTQASALLRSLTRDPSLAHSTRKLTISWSHTDSTPLDSSAPVTSLQAHALFSVLPNLREITVRHTDGLRALINRPQAQLEAMLGQLTTLRVVGPSHCQWEDLTRILAAAGKLKVLVVARLTDDAPQEEEEEAAAQQQQAAQPTQHNHIQTHTRRATLGRMNNLAPFPSTFNTPLAPTRGAGYPLARPTIPTQPMNLGMIDLTQSSDEDSDTGDDEDDDVQMVDYYREPPAAEDEYAGNASMHADDDDDDEEDELEYVETPADRHPHPIASTSATTLDTNTIDLTSEPATPTDPSSIPPALAAVELPASLSIRSLTLSAPSIRDETLLDLLRATRRSLTSFHLLGADTITRQGLLGAFQHLGALEELEMNGCEFGWGSTQPPAGVNPVHHPAQRRPRAAQPQAQGTGGGNQQQQQQAPGFNWIGRAIPPPPPPPPTAAALWPAHLAGLNWLGAGGGGGAAAGLANQNALAALLLTQQRLVQQQLLQQQQQLAQQFAPAPPRTIAMAPYDHQLAYPFDHLHQWCPFLHWLSATSDDLGSPQILREFAKLPLVCLQVGFTTPRLGAAEVREDLLERVPVDGGRLESLVVHGSMGWMEGTRREVKELCARRGTLFQWEGEEPMMDLEL